MCTGIRCPCRKWVSCSRYNSKVWEDIHPEQFDEELHRWYDTNFRISYENGENLGNG